MPQRRQNTLSIGRTAEDMIESNVSVAETRHRPVIVVEGQFNIEFLRRISRTLPAADSAGAIRSRLAAITRLAND